MAAPRPHQCTTPVYECTAPDVAAPRPHQSHTRAQHINTAHSLTWTAAATAYLTAAAVAAAARCVSAQPISPARQGKRTAPGRAARRGASYACCCHRPTRHRPVKAAARHGGACLRSTHGAHTQGISHWRSSCILQHRRPHQWRLHRASLRPADGSPPPGFITLYPRPSRRVSSFWT